MPPNPPQGERSVEGASGEEAVAAVAATQALLDRGEPLLAYDRAREGLERWPGHARLRQLQGLALARGGDAQGAHGMLAALAREGHDDAETLGMLARTSKDLGLRAPAGPVREGHFREALALYGKAYERARRESAEADALYAGINAATMAVLLGELDAARRLAGEVREIGHRSPDRAAGASDAYWREATLGEAALILGEAGEAQARYGAAARLAGRRYADLGSTRRQARLLFGHLPGAAPAAIDALAIAPVLAYTGHMIDAPGRASPRFPASIEAGVREALRERLAAMAPVAAYGSAACGIDLLCLELVREAGGETHVVLPFPPAEFRRSSVDFAGGDWAARFERALAAADSVTIASEHRAAGSTATFEYANLLFTGMARLRARLLDTGVRALAAVDPGTGAPAGGSASLLPVWEAAGLPVETLDLSRLRPPQGPARGAREAVAAQEPALPAGLRHEVRSLLFADAVGYSKLSEDQIPPYVAHFLGAVARLNARTEHRAEHVETAGDGLYLVFRDAGAAGRYALELNEAVNAADWTAAGLPASFRLRIALHSGPVFCGRDPVGGAALFTGPHTSRAARIEPVTPPGQVYASAAFAAVAAAGGADDLALRYVGRLPLAKGHGLMSLYHVDRAG